MDLQKIIEGCIRQDRKSQDELVNMFAPTLMAVCHRYCEDKSIAQDALQETFINILKYIKSYSGKGSFEGWIRRIAVNTSYKVLKKIYPVHFIDEPNDFNDFHISVPDIYSQLGTEDLIDLIQKLPKGQYLVFNMKVIEGYNHNEIGEILGINASTSRSNLTRARMKLVEMMSENKRIELAATKV